MKAAQAALLARAVILLAALAAVCLLLAGCGAESTSAAPAKAAATVSPSRAPAGVYYTEPAPGGAGFYVRRLGVPASCRAPVFTR